MRIDRPGEHDGEPDSPARRERRDPECPAPAEAPPDRAEAWADYKKAVEIEYREHAIDGGYDRVHEIEDKTISPELRRIDAEDPGRHLVGFDNRIKGKDRLTEKITEAMRFKGLSANDAFAAIKDAIRYTFQYRDDRYAAGVLEDCQRLKDAGFEPVDRKNSWDAEEYKGINSRWREPRSGQIFEVQFHTEASFEAKQKTHSAYEALRSGSATDTERDELQQYQRRVSAAIPVPPGASEIDDYRPEKRNG